MLAPDVQLVYGVMILAMGFTYIGIVTRVGLINLVALVFSVALAIEMAIDRPTAPAVILVQIAFVSLALVNAYLAFWRKD